jgi:hypothetical protein
MERAFGALSCGLSVTSYGLELWGRKGRAVAGVRAASGSFDSAAHGKAVSGFAQDDSVKQTKARATTTATAKANTGILRCAQNDNFWVE